MTFRNARVDGYGSGLEGGPIGIISREQKAAIEKLGSVVLANTDAGAAPVGLSGPKVIAPVPGGATRPLGEPLW